MLKTRLVTHTSTLARMRDRRGMSLVEIMVVIAIIGILGSVIAVNVFGFLEDANRSAAKIQMQNMQKGLIAYAAKHKGKYPTSGEGLDAAKKYFEGNAVPRDPWDNNYVYTSPGTRGNNPYEIVSYGKDGKEGGEGDDADITSWNLSNE